MTRNLATLIGFSAILLWSTIVGLLKQVSTVIGADLAVLSMYSLSAILLFALFRIPKLKNIPRTYLYVATALFVLYEICFSYAIALAQSAQQAIEISLVNYLWPSLTILMLIIFKELKFNIVVILGLTISLAGIFFIQTGNGEIDFSAVINNIQNNPLSYTLALIGATVWALYCVVTKKYSQGHNPIALFFIATSALLWLKMLVLHPDQLSQFVLVDATTLMYMLMVSVATGLGYAAWNIGINQGNITMLITLSYFSPIFASIMSMWILQTPLSKTFWIGAMMVTVGSLVCWISTNWTELSSRILRKSKSN